MYAEGPQTVQPPDTVYDSIWACFNGEYGSGYNTVTGLANQQTCGLVTTTSSDPATCYCQGLIYFNDNSIRKLF
jgi:hypothetical protein